jgi:hypothetical protein
MTGKTADGEMRAEQIANPHSSVESAVETAKSLAHSVTYPWGAKATGYQIRDENKALVHSGAF